MQLVFIMSTRSELEHQTINSKKDMMTLFCRKSAQPVCHTAVQQLNNSKKGAVDKTVFKTSTIAESSSSPSPTDTPACRAKNWVTFFCLTSKRHEWVPLLYYNVFCYSLVFSNWTIASVIKSVLTLVTDSFSGGKMKFHISQGCYFL